MSSLGGIWDAAVQQRLFRAVMQAMARPGMVGGLGALTEGQPAARAVLATFMDGSVSLSDPHGLLEAADWPLLQARQTSPEEADYVLCDGALAPDFQPKLGTLPSPDFSATLLLSVARLGEGATRLRVSGPGVNGRAELTVDGLNPAWLMAREDWVCAFPLGVDVILADAERVAALPRTTHVKVL